MSNDLALIEGFRSKIESQFGRKTSFEDYVPLEGVSTGLSGIDRYIKGHGFPRGMLSELSGDTQVGKSTFMLEACGLLNQKGERTLYIDVEGTTTPDYAERCGCDSELMDLYDTKISAEANLHFVVEAIKSDLYGLIVVDSLAALVPKSQMDNVDDQYALPRVITEALRAICQELKGKNCAVVIINQLRMKKSQVAMPDGTQQMIEKPSGPLMVDYAVSLRIRLAAVQPIMDNGAEVGVKLMAAITKNKLGRSMVTSNVSLLADYGFNKAAEVLSQAVQLGVASRKGTSVQYNGSTIGKNVREACSTVRNTLELYQQLYTDVVETTPPVIKHVDNI